MKITQMPWTSSRKILGQYKEIKVPEMLAIVALNVHELRLCKTRQEEVFAKKLSQTKASLKVLLEDSLEALGKLDDKGLDTNLFPDFPKGFVKEIK